MQPPDLSAADPDVDRDHRDVEIRPRAELGRHRLDLQVEGRGEALEWEHFRAWLSADEIDLLESVSEFDDEALVRRLLDK